MAKEKDGDVAEVELVDVSPEAQEARRLVGKAGPTLLDRGRVQAIIQNYLERNPELVDPINGQSIPSPPIVVAPQWISDIDAQLIPMIQNCIARSRSTQLDKWRGKRQSNLHGGNGVEGSLATTLRSPRGRIIEQVEPG